jgi:hypothetical protein
MGWSLWSHTLNIPHILQWACMFWTWMFHKVVFFLKNILHEHFIIKTITPNLTKHNTLCVCGKYSCFIFRTFQVQMLKPQPGNWISWPSGSVKKGSRVRQKHNCLVVLFIAAIATTCFGCAWPSSGHNVDAYKWEKHDCMSGWFAAAVWVGEVRCGWGSRGEGFCGLRMCRILSGVDATHLYASTLWPEDGQARPKHVVAIAAINRTTRQLCFWQTLLPSFNIRKHNGDDEPEVVLCFPQSIKQMPQYMKLGHKCFLPHSCELITHLSN